MPANVKPGRIVSLVQIINDHVPSIDLPRLANELSADVAVFLPIIDAAEMLGLVERQKGKLKLTDFELTFHKTIRNSDKIRLLKDNLTKIEPFKTSIRLTNQKRTVNAADIAGSLRKNGVQWDRDPELNESFVNNLLIPWAILAGILSYDGRTQKFSAIPEKYI